MKRKRSNHLKSPDGSRRNVRVWDGEYLRPMLFQLSKYRRGHLAMRWTATSDGGGGVPAGPRYVTI
jgi:hypothetical protein